MGFTSILAKAMPPLLTIKEDEDEDEVALLPASSEYVDLEKTFPSSSLITTAFYRTLFSLSPALSSFKTWILILLCIQNAGYSLIRKYSVSTQSVSSKEILLVGEVLKVLIAGSVVLTSTEKSDAQGVGFLKIVWLIRNSRKMFVLAGI